MKRPIQACRGFRRCQSGAVAIEFAIISLVMILVCLGVIEIGRGLHMRNELSFTADFGARKILTDTTISDTKLEEVVRDAFTTSDPDLLQVTIGTEAVDDLQFRTIVLSYPFSPLVPGLAGDAISLSLERRIPVS